MGALWYADVDRRDGTLRGLAVTPTRLRRAAPTASARHYQPPRVCAARDVCQVAAARPHGAAPLDARAASGLRQLPCMSAPALHMRGRASTGHARHAALPAAGSCPSLSRSQRMCSTCCPRWTGSAGSWVAATACVLVREGTGWSWCWTSIAPEIQGLEGRKSDGSGSMVHKNHRLGTSSSPCYPRRHASSPRSLKPACDCAYLPFAPKLPSDVCTSAGSRCGWLGKGTAADARPWKVPCCLRSCHFLPIATVLSSLPAARQQAAFTHQACLMQNQSYHLLAVLGSGSVLWPSHYSVLLHLPTIPSAQWHACRIPRMWTQRKLE